MLSTVAAVRIGVLASMSCFVVAACSSTSSPSSEGDVDAGKDGSAFEAGAEGNLLDEAGTCSADVTKDPNNCGNCGVKCGEKEVCTDSTCAGTCSGAKTECSRACVNLPTDDENCGTCGNACDEGAACSEGRCRACNAAPTELSPATLACEFALPGTFTAADVLYSTIVFVKSDGKTVLVPENAVDGWMWDDAKAPKLVRLFGAACTATTTGGYGNPKLTVSCKKPYYE